MDAAVSISHSSKITLTLQYFWPQRGRKTSRECLEICQDTKL